MLSFPAQNWKTTIQRTTHELPPTQGLHGPKYGRSASQITPRLYLSDYFTASDADEIEKLGVTHIISVLDHRPYLPDSVPIQRRMQVFIADRADANILIHLEETTNFISATLAENDTNKVLIHCFQGVSRSATVVCAYLIATTGMEPHESISHVQSIRGIVCPNPGFRKQLEQYANRFDRQKIKKSLSSTSKGSKIGEGIAQKVRRIMPGIRRITPSPIEVNSSS